MTALKVLLSHINDEARVASVLGQWIESSLDRDVRLSGEATNGSLDGQRVAEVDQALGEARVVVLLCSERSVGRPWISFESGCAWLKGVPVVVVCYCGCSAADLPPPLGSFQAVELSDAASCQALLEALADHLQKKRIPRIDFDLMVAELAAAAGAGQSEAPAQPSDGFEAPAAPQSSGAAEPAPAQQTASAPAAPLELRLLAAIKRSDDFTCTAPDLATSLKERERAVRSTLEQLVRDQLLTLRVSTHPTDPETRYAVTDKGRMYVTRHSR